MNGARSAGTCTRTARASALRKNQPRGIRAEGINFSADRGRPARVLSRSSHSRFAGAFMQDCTSNKRQKVGRAAVGAVRSGMGRTSFMKFSPVRSVVVALFAVGLYSACGGGDSTSGGFGDFG